MKLSDYVEGGEHPAITELFNLSSMCDGRARLEDLQSSVAQKGQDSIVRARGF